MNKKHLHRLATELALPLPQIEATTTLLAQGGTGVAYSRPPKDITHSRTQRDHEQKKPPPPRH